jgi:hypothetical protein
VAISARKAGFLLKPNKDDSAALRNLAIGLVRRLTRHKSMPDAFRRFIADPLAALALIFTMPKGKN